jgi:hypothetical protein
MLFQALARENLGIVLQDTCRVSGGCAERAICCLYFVCRKHDALAQEVRQDVVDTDELQSPLKRVQDVGFLRHELIVVIGDANEVKKLVNAGVCFLQIFGRYEHTCEPDQRDHVWPRLPLEVFYAGQMLLDI